MTVKQFEVKTIEFIEDNIAFVFPQKKDAMNALKKNPKATFMEGQDDECILIYNNKDIDLSRSIKRI